MKTYLFNTRILAFILCFSFVALAAQNVQARKKVIDDPADFVAYKGKVVDAESMVPLVFATVAIEGTNIATVTNVDGKFILKVPNNVKATQLKVSFIGYESQAYSFNELKSGKSNVLKLKQVAVSITEINVFPKDPRVIIDKVMSMRSKTYMGDPVLMKAFYRETIQKKKTYVGLSEAVVQVYKQPYNSYRQDMVSMFKGRKSSDTKKLDTLIFKLQGGPHSTLALDIVKDPYMVLDQDVLDSYEYTFANITRIDGKLNYVIDFKQRPHVKEPLFFGKIYIDVDDLVISSIAFNLNTENKSEASQMFIKRKPLGVNVYPTSANYIVNYRKYNDRWLYNYARGEVTFKVKWKKRLFNTNYTTMVEMASTDWERAEGKPFKSWNRLKMNVVMAEAVNGFADKEFWGEYNIIEPEQSIESAIKKIKKNLSKLE